MNRISFLELNVLCMEQEHDELMSMIKMYANTIRTLRSENAKLKKQNHYLMENINYLKSTISSEKIIFKRIGLDVDGWNGDL